MAFLKGVWYVIKNIVFIILAIVCVFLINSLVTNPASAIWVMILLFLFIPTEFIKVADIGDGWGLFVEDFTGCIVGALLGFGVAMALCEFAIANPGVFAGIYVLIIALLRGLDYKKFFEECTPFSNVAGGISVLCIIVFAIILMANNTDVDASFQSGFSIAVLTIGIITWVYTIFAHAVRADDADY